MSRWYRPDEVTDEKILQEVVKLRHLHSKVEADRLALEDQIEKIVSIMIQVVDMRYHNDQLDKR